MNEAFFIPTYFEKWALSPVSWAVNSGRRVQVITIAWANECSATTKEVKEKSHGAKNGKLTDNPDVEVCNDCGEIFPQTESGELGDSIGNIEDDY